MSYCPECGIVIPASTKPKLYCSSTCQQAQGARRKGEGASIVLIAKAYHETRHRQDARGRVICAKARKELAARCKEFSRADAEAGRMSAADLFATWFEVDGVDARQAFIETREVRAIRNASIKATKAAQRAARAEG